MLGWYLSNKLRQLRRLDRIQACREICLLRLHIRGETQVLMHPLPLALLILMRHPCPPERGIKRYTTRRAPSMLDHRAERPVWRDSRDLNVLELHLAVVPVWEDGVEVFFKAATDGVAKHVVAEHVVEIVEAAGAHHAVVVVSARFEVPIVQPAAVELVEDFLFCFYESGVVVFAGFHRKKVVLFSDSAIFGIILNKSVFIHDCWLLLRSRLRFELSKSGSISGVYRYLLD